MSEQDHGFHEQEARLEEWMQVWQSQVDPIEELREDFISRTQRTRRVNYMVIGWLLVCCTGLIVRAILFPEAFTIAVTAIAVPFVLYVIARIFRWQSLYKQAPPMTPTSYLATMRLHLQVQRAQHQWDNRLWPLVVLGPGAIIIWALIRTGFAWPVVLTVFLVGGPAYAWGFWESFYNKPKKLEKEEERLRELERDLEID